ncbi:MAG TPA: tetratricopeptide repeat protein [Terracidiphilus sp.]|nr:tetratricopeptide repeat protein [Terracidiphilus sp.]
MKTKAALLVALFIALIAIGAGYYLVAKSSLLAGVFHRGDKPYSSEPGIYAPFILEDYQSASVTTPNEALLAQICNSVDSGSHNACEFFNGKGNCLAFTSCSESNACEDDFWNNLSIVACYKSGFVREDVEAKLKELRSDPLHYISALCDKGNPVDCTELAWVTLHHGHIQLIGGSITLFTVDDNDSSPKDTALVQKDDNRAAALYSQSCDAGIAFACRELGVMYRQGEGVTVDAVRAAKLLKQALDGGNTEANTELGWAYENGIGVEKDVFQAVKYYSNACNAKFFDACGNLGVIYRDGNGVENDDVKANELFEKACSGSATQCSKLGWMYEKGRGVFKSIGKAKDNYAKACKGRDKWSCERLKEL